MKKIRIFSAVLCLYLLLSCFLSGCQKAPANAPEEPEETRPFADITADRTACVIFQEGKLYYVLEKEEAEEFITLLQPVVLYHPLTEEEEKAMRESIPDGSWWPKIVLLSAVKNYFLLFFYTDIGTFCSMNGVFYRCNEEAGHAIADFYDPYFTKFHPEYIR